MERLLCFVSMSDVKQSTETSVSLTADGWFRIKVIINR